jgi:hypothetical protein
MLFPAQKSRFLCSRVGKKPVFHHKSAFFIRVAALIEKCGAWLGEASF